MPDVDYTVLTAPYDYCWYTDKENECPINEVRISNIKNETVINNLYEDTNIEWFRGDNISLAPIVGLYLAAPDVEETPLLKKEPGFSVYKSMFYLENGLGGH